MIKIVSISLFLILNLHNLMACDVCGCSIGNGFSTILPQFNKNLLGIRGSYNQFNSHHVNDFSHINHEKSISAELWGRIYLHEKFQLIATIPYNIKSRKEDGITTAIKGIGDASLTLNYTLFNINADSLKWKHLLLTGAGIKLPTGLLNMNKSNAIYLQPGSGSVDYLFNILYTIRHNKIGLSNDLQYNINNENSDKYAFGNRTSITSKIFYWQRIKMQYNVLPSLGILYEKYDKDYKSGYVQYETGGFTTSLSTGVELYYKSLFFSINYNRPVKQNLSNGNLQLISKMQANASFLF